jgi:GT2 family glycosyltransferase
MSTPKVLVIGLTYGNRPTDIIVDNLKRAGHSSHHAYISKEGIANALNDGLELLSGAEYDCIAFLSNDIVEPDNWLYKKVEALYTYPQAGIVASSLDTERTEIQIEHIISNWLIRREVIRDIGYFNENFFPYGPIDLDYCVRANTFGWGTYYVKNCLATHSGTANGNEYGYNKQEIVQKYWEQHVSDVSHYMNGVKHIYMNRLKKDDGKD